MIIPVKPKAQFVTLVLIEKLENQIMHMKICLSEGRIEDARAWHGIIETTTQQLYSSELWPQKP